MSLLALAVLPFLLVKEILQFSAAGNKAYQRVVKYFNFISLFYWLCLLKFISGWNCLNTWKTTTFYIADHIHDNRTITPG